ncbi:histidine phosphatase family protein [Celeribacter baekdonensis]|uniref:Phosphoglycerate mutase n=1 Tax=Celeribacter baekdonensis TaxID=875171 RepID=A0A2R4M4N7_9RHOB|nr:histidine phosphatase family protein [Celeribacter baekdonensis]AVW92174.1 phosphoglycerate mutase [Celeribacter baekdonensis]|tara:strand:+ start:13456 stop:13962 length:507 start_codon:yes stop_codon:yes gene_type:complete
MGLRLVLMRHAKSSWDDPLSDDFDRVLNARGQSNAAAMGIWLRDKGYLPDQVWVSAAARTRETYEWLSNGMGLCANVVVKDTLYLASDMRIMSELKQAQGDTVLVIAHNPGIGEFAARFANRAPLHKDFARYPTCATTVFDVAAPTWSEITFGTNPIAEFVTPRDLTD